MKTALFVRFVACAVLTSMPLGRAVSAATWDTPGTSSTWSAANQWDPAAVPQNVDVTIDGETSSASVVSLDVSATIHNLTVHAGDTLIMNVSPFVLTVDGSATPVTVNNAGTIRLDGNVSGGKGLSIQGDVTWQGTGLSVVGNQNWTQFKILDGATLTLEAGVVFDFNNQTWGTGTLINHGTFDIGGLFLGTGTQINDGVMALSDRKIFHVTNFVGSTDGTLSLRGNQEGGSSVTGGVLHFQNGNYEIGRSGLGHMLTLDGGVDVSLEAGRTLTLGRKANLILDSTGTYTFDGVVEMNVIDPATHPNAINSHAFLTARNGTVNLSGAGSLVMSSGDLDDNGTGILKHSVLTGLASSDQIRNNLVGGIVGAGNIGRDVIGIVNDALIDATDSTYVLAIDPINTSSFVNTSNGVLRATGGPGLLLKEGTFLNNGTIDIQPGSTAVLAASATLTNSNGTVSVTLGDSSVSTTPVLHAQGDVTLSGVLQVDVDSAFDGVQGDRFDVITADGIITNNDIRIVSANPEYEFRIYDDGTVDGSLTIGLKEPQPIPTPSDAYPRHAHLIAPADAANFQTLLDQHSIVRLLPGDYRTNGPVQITLSSGQQIYGLPGSEIPELVLQGDITGVVVSTVHPKKLRFLQSTSVIRGNFFNRLGSTPITIEGARVEDNLFVGMENASIIIDNTTDGFARNNRFVRFTVHSSYPQLVMEGNTSSGLASRGNVFLWFNFLTSHGDTAYIEHQEDLSLVGIDAESWNWKQYAIHPGLITTGDMGTLRIFGANGGNNLPAAHHTQLINTNAQELHMVGARINQTRLVNPNITTGAATQRMMSLDSNAYTLDTATLAPYRLAAFEGWGNDSVTVNEIAPTIPMNASDAQQAREMFNDADRFGVPWEQPTFAALPDPLGPTWQTDIVSLPDQSAYLQQRINAENIVLLDAGVYVIDTPLILADGQGIIGAGKGQTVIVARNQTIDLFTTTPTANRVVRFFVLGDLTLQGGRNGLVCDQPDVDFVRVYFSHVVMRHMANAGVLLDSTYAWDNNYIDHVSFVDCDTAIKQRPDPNYSGGDTPTMTFMDKNFWYRCQFIRCRVALDLAAKRANNLNAYFECLFKDNTERAVVSTNNLSSLYANCLFTGNTGSQVMETNQSVRLVSCTFESGANNQAMLPLKSIVEGCTFDASGTSGSKVLSGSGTSGQAIFINSDASNMSLGPIWDGLFANSISLDAAYNHALVRVHDALVDVLDSTASTPKPQLLWGSKFTDIPAY